MTDHSPTAKQWQGCAVCGYPLSHRRSDDTWFHGRIDLEDHIAVPVDMRLLQYNQKCDFCDANDPGWVESRSIGPWTACDDCKPLVEKRYWTRLVSRVQQAGGTFSRQPAQRRTLLDVWNLLERHMYGIITAAEWRERNQDYWEMPVD